MPGRMRLFPTIPWRRSIWGAASIVNAAILALLVRSIGSLTTSGQPFRAGNPSYEPLPQAYRRSLHVIVVDAGDCGACLHEVKQLNNPLYNVHRLGIFFTPTPRAADVF